MNESSAVITVSPRIRPLDHNNVADVDQAGKNGWNWSHRLEGDGLICLLYHHLWKKDKHYQCCQNVRIPDTVVYEHGFPRGWYAYDFKNNEIIRRNGKYLDTNHIYEGFSKQIDGCEVVAKYMHTYEEEGTGRFLTSVEFFTKEELFHFLNVRKDRTEGVLQRFVPTRTKNNQQIQAIWSPKVTLVRRRCNRHEMHDRTVSLYERCVTFNGPSHYSEDGHVAQRTRNEIGEICQVIVNHFYATDHKHISRMVLHFKVDRHDNIWLLWSNSIRIAPSKFNATAKRLPLDLAPHFVPPPHQVLGKDLSSDPFTSPERSTMRMGPPSVLSGSSVSFSGNGPLGGEGVTDSLEAKLLRTDQWLYKLSRDPALIRAHRYQRMKGLLPSLVPKPPPPGSSTRPSRHRLPSLGNHSLHESNDLQPCVSGTEMAFQGSPEECAVRNELMQHKVAAAAILNDLIYSLYSRSMMPQPNPPPRLLINPSDELSKHLPLEESARALEILGFVSYPDAGAGVYSTPPRPSARGNNRPPAPLPLSHASETVHGLLDAYFTSRIRALFEGKDEDFLRSAELPSAAELAVGYIPASDKKTNAYNNPMPIPASTSISSSDGVARQPNPTPATVPTPPLNGFTPKPPPRDKIEPPKSLAHPRHPLA